MTKTTEPLYVDANTPCIHGFDSQEYCQACETPDWDKTTAYHFCRALKRLVTTLAIPESEEDEWLWTACSRACSSGTVDGGEYGVYSTPKPSRAGVT